jgi:hypothetical protein
MEEWPNESLVARHQHEIAPLLKNRHLFAESTNFVLYDFWTSHGNVDENVFAYSNRSHGQRAVILYNNSYGSTRGTIHFSAASMDKMTGNLRQRSLAEGLDLPYDYGTFFACRDTAHGLEYLRRSTDLHHTGLSIDLRGYQYAVLLHWRELRATADQPWDQLFDALNGAGVHSVEEALSKLRLRPLHEAFRQALSPANIKAFAAVASDLAKRQQPSTPSPATPPSSGATEKPATASRKTSTLQPKTNGLVSPAAAIPIAPPIPDEHTLDPRLHAFAESSQRFFERIQQMMPSEIEESTQQPHALNSAEESTSTHSAPLSADTKAKPSTAKKPLPPPTYRESCETLTKAAAHLLVLSQKFSAALPPALGSFLPSTKVTHQSEQIWAPILAWITLRSLPRRDNHSDLFDKLQLRSALSEIFNEIGMEGENTWRAAARVCILLSQQTANPQAEDLWSNPDVRWLTGLNESSGISYFNKEGFEELLGWLQLPALLQTVSSLGTADSIAKLETSVLASCQAAQKAGYRLDLYLNPEPAKTTEDPPPSAAKRKPASARGVILP